MKQGTKYGIIAGIGVLCITAGIGVGLGVGNILNKNKAVPVSTIEEEKEEKEISKPLDQVENENNKDEAEEANEPEQVNTNKLNGLEKYEDHKIIGSELLENSNKWAATSEKEWQESLVQQRIGYINDPYSYLLPDSGESKITAYEYFGLNKELCDLARNEIYARHGYKFTKPEYVEAFANKQWYIPSVSDINQIKLSKEEIFNVNCLKWWADACSIDQTIIKDKNYSDCYFFDINTPFQIDLNGDGTLEEVVFKGTKDEYDEYRETWIEINGVKSDIMDGFWQEGITIVDIDPSDSYLELVTYDMGPSSDPVNYYYFYDKGTLTCMGATAGNLNSDTYIKDKILHAVTRSDILGTNYYRCNYELTADHMWRRIPCDLVDVNIPIIANVDIAIYDQRDINAKKTVCKEGTPLLAIQTDCKQWIKVKFEDSHEGWINSESLPVWDSLGGLLWCD